MFFVVKPVLEEIEYIWLEAKSHFYVRKQLCFQRVLAIAILSVRPSVRLSVTQVDQAKTVQARINLHHRLPGRL